MKKIVKASILNRSSRNHWYIKYKVAIENGKIEYKEESTKVLKTEETLAYMTNTYLPAWIIDKEDKFNKNLTHSTTLEYYALEFLDECTRHIDYDNIKDRTKRIITEFGSEDIINIKKRHIKKWLNNLMNIRTGEELSKTYRNKFKRIFNGIFTLAVEDEVLNINYIPDIKIYGKKSDDNEVAPFSIEEVNILLEASKDLKYGELLHPYLGLTFNLGLSPHEAIALQIYDKQWDEIHQKNVLHIQRCNEALRKTNLVRQRMIIEKGLLLFVKKYKYIWIILLKRLIRKILFGFLVIKMVLGYMILKILEEQSNILIQKKVYMNTMILNGINC